MGYNNIYNLLSFNGEYRVLMESQLLPLFPVLLSFFGFVFVILRSSRSRKTSDSNSIQPPGPWKLPLIGNIHQMVCSLPHRRLSDLAKIYGPLMHLQLGEISTVVVSSPEIAEEVMKTHDSKFATRPKHISAEIIFYNYKDIASAPYGDYWRQMRKICTVKLFSAKRVQGMSSIRNEKVSEFIESISSMIGSNINLSEMLRFLSFDITLKAAFGGKCEGDNTKAFVPLVCEITEVLAGFGLADMFPSVKLLQLTSGMSSKLERLHRQADEILENLINERKVKKAEEHVHDFLDVLLNLQENGDFQIPLTPDDIKAVIMDIFLAGSDTSSTVIEWAMAEMMKNPCVMQKAQKVVRTIFDTKGFVDVECLEELEFLKLVIKETMRLHPPGPLLIARECMETCQINGYEIPIGTKVIINAWAIGRDPNHWKEPEKFYPERFIDHVVDYNGNNFEFIPFGAGRRRCAGILLGLANVELTIARLLYHFDWKLPNNEELDMEERYSANLRRKSDLCLVPTSYRSS